MPFANQLTVNFASGELSPLVDARSDLKVYKQSASRIQNYIALPQGSAEFRSGFQFVSHTRLYQNARFIPFQFNDQQSYLIEVTNQRFRFYTNNAIIVESDVSISGATQANPVVITTGASHSYATGDEVYINDVVGMTELNGKSYRITVLSATTFSLQDIDGNNIDGTGFTAYSSSGNASRVYEVITPYLAADIEELQYTQNADTMYITHQKYETRKLTRSGNTNWSLSYFTRTADPFDSKQTITGITQANPAVVTVTGHGLSTGNQVYIQDVVGMTEVNATHFLITSLTADTFSLQDLSGNNIDSTGYTSYSSAGSVELYNGDDYPRSCAFTDDARIVYGGTAAKPETLWFSMGPNSGTLRYDNFTTGTNDTDSLSFTLAPVHGKVDSIRWLANSDKFLLAGTFGTVRRIYGATEQEPVTPTSITAKSVNTVGCAYTISISNGINVFYIQRGDDVVRSFEYDYVIDGYLTTDRNLVSEHITRGGLKQLTNQLSTYNVLWAVRNDGVIIGMTYNNKEDISGWHRHYLAGSHRDSNNATINYGKALWLGTMPRENADEQLWVIVERYINGATRRYVEYLNDRIEVKEPEDFFVNESSYEADLAKYTDYLYEKYKADVHLDSAITYDGSAIGLAASSAITPAAITGTGVTFTASAAVFTSSMVGRQIWKKYDENGEGGGRAEITAFTSSTQVTCTIKSDFNTADQIPAGDWYLTATSLSGLDHLEGETVDIVGDFAPQNPAIVEGGALTLESPVAVCHVGLRYIGLIQTLNLDFGGVIGPAYSKYKNVDEVVIRFLNTVGAFVGTKLGKLERAIFRSSSDKMGRGVPAFKGFKRINVEDDTAREKYIYILQNRPLPNTIQGIDIFMDVTDE